MNFHEYYSNLLEKLYPSIKKNIWNRLIPRLHNPLTEEQASSIHPDIEILITSEIDKYEKKKNQQRIKTSSIQNSEIRIQARPEETILKDHIQVINSEKEIN